MKDAAQWVARGLRLGRFALGQTLPGKLALELGIPLTHWLLERGWDYIRAYNDPPKTLEELRENLYYANGKWSCASGYEADHIVEQAQARSEGYAEEKIQDRDNVVCISTLKHWEVTGWMMEHKEDYVDDKGMPSSPRHSLKGKNWEEKYQVGLKALRRHGVLKP